MPKNNTTISPCGRRYTDDIKEFSLTLYFYSPKAYEYVRSIIPLPNPSLIQKWSSSVDCEPGFLQEAFQSLQSEVDKTPSKRDCCLIVDAMAIRKQTLWDQKNQKYSGFVNYGPIIPEDPETLASEALVFMLVGTRTRWKCPIGYFLADKINAKTQAQLVRMALEKAADAGLRRWYICQHQHLYSTGLCIWYNLRLHGDHVQAPITELQCVCSYGSMSHAKTRTECTSQLRLIL